MDMTNRGVTMTTFRTTISVQARIISVLFLACSSLLGMAPVAALAEQASAPGLALTDNPPDRHVVVRGDTLWDIAKRYPGVSVDDLKRLNGGAVQDGLKVGDRIKVGVQEG